MMDFLRVEQRRSNDQKKNSTCEQNTSHLNLLQLVVASCAAKLQFRTPTGRGLGRNIDSGDRRRFALFLYFSFLTDLRDLGI